MVLLLRIHAALRKKELFNLKMRDINQIDCTKFEMSIKRSKTGSKTLVFAKAVDGTHHRLCPFETVAVYLSIVPKNLKENAHECRFLLRGRFQNKLCIQYGRQAFSSQPRGRNWVESLGPKIAECLGPENPGEYTSQCMRRSAATEAANFELDTTDLKRKSKWMSSESAERSVIHWKQKFNYNSDMLLTQPRELPSFLSVSPHSSNASVIRKRSQPNFCEQKRPRILDSI
jgi:hypothetical protein